MGVLDDELPVKLVDGAEDGEHEPTLRRGGVDLLLEDHQADAALAEVLGEREQVLREGIAWLSRVITNTSRRRRTGTPVKPDQGVDPGRFLFLDPRSADTYPNWNKVAGAASTGSLVTSNWTTRP